MIHFTVIGDSDEVDGGQTYEQQLSELESHLDQISQGPSMVEEERTHLLPDSTSKEVNNTQEPVQAPAEGI